MSVAFTRFGVTLDAADDASFRAALEAIGRTGVEVEAVGGALPPGTICLLDIAARDGSRSVIAEAKVARVLGPARLHVQPTKYREIVTQQAAELEQLVIEGSRTAALPAKSLPQATADAAKALAARESSVREVSARATGAGSARGNSAGGSLGKVDAGPPELEAFESLGNYQVLKHLGGGGMAEVYLARSLLGQGVDKLVALKTARAGFGPDTPYGAMFLDEARVSATLQHPNLVQVFDFGEAAGRPYLAMEFLAGRDLSAVLRELRARKMPAPPSVVVAVGLALCRALESVHEKRDADGRELHLVHRDVGPANLMLTPRSEVKLMDFGVAASEGSVGETAGLMVGKLPYMPAEQLLGGQPAPDWDLYAAGVTLYQLACLYHPYRGNPLEYLPTPALRAHRGPPSGANTAIPASLDAVLVSATQLDAHLRPHSARELREALEAVQRETGPADLGTWLSALFGEALAREEAEAQALVVEGRRRSEREVPALLRPFLRPLEAVRRKVVYSQTYRRLARRPWVLRSLAAGLLTLVLAGGTVTVVVRNERAQRRAAIQKADGHLLVGRLVSAGSDDGLDQLLEAKKQWPDDVRVTTRLSRLAARLETLGTLALERGNLEEAAAHLEAALRAEPGRAGATAQLKAVEEKVRERSRAKVLQSP